MKFSPNKNNKGRKMSIRFLLMGCVGLLTATMFEMMWSLFFQVLAYSCFMISLLFLWRYEITHFLYHFDGRRFFVYKTVGKKRQCVCNLEMQDALAIVQFPRKRKARRAMEKIYGKVDVFYNFSQTMRPKQAYVLLFLWNGRITEIIFEPSEEMVLALKRAIAETDLEIF